MFGCCCSKQDAQNLQVPTQKDGDEGYDQGYGDEYGEGAWEEEWWDEEYLEGDEYYYEDDEGGEEQADDPADQAPEPEAEEEEPVENEPPPQVKSPAKDASTEQEVTRPPATDVSPEKEDDADAANAQLSALQERSDLPAIVEEDAMSTKRSSMLTPQKFNVELRKPSPTSACGWQLDSMDPDVLFVSTLSADPACPVQVYNKSAIDEHRLRPGDYLIQVNGEIGAKAMANQMKSKAILHAVVQRPSIVEITISKGGLPLGLGMKFSPQGSCLLVEDIGPGAVKEGNHNVRNGDRIVAVCGLTGSQQKLLARLKASDPVVLRISRYAKS